MGLERVADVWLAGSHLYGDQRRLADLTGADIPSERNDYEVKTTLTADSGTGKGTFIQFLRASSNAMSGSVTGSGPYVSVELVIP